MRSPLASLDLARALFVTDLDGTLIRDDLSLSAWARAELVTMLEAGAPLTVATARSIVSLSAILGPLPFRLPVVEFNGAFVSEYATGRHLLVNAMEPGAAEETYGKVRRAGMQPFLSTWDGTRDGLYWRSTTNEGEEAYYRERLQLRDGRLRRVDDLAVGLRERVICVTLIDREARLREMAAALAAALGARVQVTIYSARYSPGWHFMSVHGAGATKENGIAALRAMAGLEGAPLVVFGDDANDMGMFRAADHAVATANARDEVKAIAHEVIGSNQEDSVVRWLAARLRPGAARR